MYVNFCTFFFAFSSFTRAINSVIFQKLNLHEILHLFKTEDLPMQEVNAVCCLVNKYIDFIFPGSVIHALPDHLSDADDQLLLLISVDFPCVYICGTVSTPIHTSRGICWKQHPSVSVEERMTSSHFCCTILEFLLKNISLNIHCHR